jgi:hypothetical protein
MKLTKILFSATVAGVIAFAASKASALPAAFPWVKLNISGTVTASAETSTTNGTTIKSSPLKKVSFNTQKLIDLLNASPTFVAALTNQFHSTSSNSVPSGSYFVWNPDDYNLIITNKNGFSFTLDSNLSGKDFGYMEIDEDFLTGTYTENVTTDAGSEDNLTGIYFEFYDYNGDEIEVYGEGKLSWHYDAMSAGSQKTSLSVSMSGSGYYAEVDGDEAGSTFKASGSGTGTDPVGQNPFLLWY